MQNLVYRLFSSQYTYYALKRIYYALQSCIKCCFIENRDRDFVYIMVYRTVTVYSNDCVYIYKHTFINHFSLGGAPASNNDQPLHYNIEEGMVTDL